MAKLMAQKAPNPIFSKCCFMETFSLALVCSGIAHQALSRGTNRNPLSLVHWAVSSLVSFLDTLAGVWDAYSRCLSHLHLLSYLSSLACHLPVRRNCISDISGFHCVPTTCARHLSVLLDLSGKKDTAYPGSALLQTFSPLHFLCCLKVPELICHMEISGV